MSGSLMAAYAPVKKHLKFASFKRFLDKNHINVKIFGIIV